MRAIATNPINPPSSSNIQRSSIGAGTGAGSTALSVCVPSVVKTVVQVAVELLAPWINVTAAHKVVPPEQLASGVVVPAQNVTVPVGGSPATMTVIVTGLPGSAGFGLALSVTVGVPWYVY